MSVCLPQQGYLFHFLCPPSSGFRNKVSTPQILKCVWDVWEKKKRKKPWLAGVCCLDKGQLQILPLRFQPHIQFTLPQMWCWDSRGPLAPPGCGLALQQTRHDRAWASESRSLTTSWPLHTSPEQPAFWLFCCCCCSCKSHHVAWRILVPQTAVEVLSLNHSTAREIPLLHFMQERIHFLFV